MRDAHRAKLGHALRTHVHFERVHALMTNSRSSCFIMSAVCILLAARVNLQ
jgi:hypothetical protein